MQFNVRFVTRILPTLCLWAICCPGARADLTYATDYASSTILRIDQLGNVSTFAAGLAGPTGIAVSASGDVYVANSDIGTVRRFSAAGLDLGDFVTATDYDLSGLAFDSSGNLYVGNWTGPNFGQDGTIRKYAPDGSSLGVFATFTVNDLPNAFGPAGYFSMSFDAQGNLWAVDDFFGRLYKFDTSGNNLLDIRTRGAFASAVAPNGEVYVSDYYEILPGVLESGIHKFSSTGVDLGYVANNTPFMAGMGFDSNGDLIAALPDVGEIRRFSIGGQDLGLIATAGFPAGIAFAPSAVPEPCSMLLCSATALIGLFYRKKSPRPLR